MLIASTFLLWMIVAVLAIAVLALVRQVGVIHERIASAGAPGLDASPRAGELAPDIDAITLDGQALAIGPGHMGPRNTLLMFVDPDCAACRKIAPLAKAVAAVEDIDLVFIGQGEDDALRAMVDRYKLGGFPFANSASVGLAFGIGTLPYGVLLHPDGVIAAKGSVNSRDQLESLTAAGGPAPPTVPSPVQSSNREVTA